VGIVGHLAEVLRGVTDGKQGQINGLARRSQVARPRIAANILLTVLPAVTMAAATPAAISADKKAADIKVANKAEG
jgi:hypothetical protein